MKNSAAPTNIYEAIKNCVDSWSAPQRKLYEQQITGYVESAKFRMQVRERYYPDGYVRKLIVRGTCLDGHLGADIPDAMVKAKRTELIVRRMIRENQERA